MLERRVGERQRIDRGLLCAVPPVPGKPGLAASQRFGPYRGGRTLRSPYSKVAAFRQAPDTVRVAAVLVDFEDQPMDSSRAYFERVLLHQHQYWNQVSLGQLVITSTLTDSVYRLPETMDFYGDDDLFGERQTLFVRDAVQAGDSEFDYSRFDAVFCIHAGGGQEADIRQDSEEQLWSVFVPLEALAFYLPDSTAAQGIATDDLTPEGDPYFVEMGLVLPEYESQDTNDLGKNFVFGVLGVYAHEFGHVLGLPDLYDTTPADFPDSQGIGRFGVMGAGTWNADGFMPSNPCVWTLFELGYVDPVVVTDDATVALEAIERPAAGPQVALIPLGGDEYFLIENRLKDLDGDDECDFFNADGDTLFTPFDLSLPAEQTDSYAGAEFDFFLPGVDLTPDEGPDIGLRVKTSVAGRDTVVRVRGSGFGSGLLIWHIDPSTIESLAPFNIVQDDPRHKGVDLEEADEIEDLDVIPESLLNFGSAYDAYRADNATVFGPETIPSTVTSYGAPSFITIDNISASGQVMTFDVRFRSDGERPRRKPGWTPITLNGRVGGNHMMSADLAPAPGLESVVIDTTGAVYVIGGDGTSPYGGDPAVPIGTLGPGSATSPALADLDQDGSLDIVAVARDGRVFAWSGADGAELLDGDADPGTLGVWNTLDGEFPNAVPVIAGLHGRGSRPAVIVGSRADSASAVSRLYWSIGRQGLVDTESVELPGHATAPVLVFEGSPNPETAWILAATTRGPETRFFAVFPTLAGFPVVELTRDRVTTGAVRSLVTGDLDADGAPEIIATDHLGQIEVYRLPGAPSLTPEFFEATPTDLIGVEGWPYRLGMPVAHDVSLADIDRDGHLEVLVSVVDGRVLAINFNGSPQLRFPVLLEAPPRNRPRLVPAPLALSLDGHDAPVLIAAGGDGRLLAVDGDGRRLPGFLIPGPVGDGPTPIVADLDADGELDALIPADIAGRAVLHAYELDESIIPGSPWPGYRGGGSLRAAVAPPGSSPPADGSLLEEVYVYPNPVRGSRAHVHFSLRADARVKVTILDVTGRVAGEPLSSGPIPGRTEHVIPWNVTDQPTGVYVAMIEAEVGGSLDVRHSTFAVTR